MNLFASVKMSFVRAIMVVALSISIALPLLPVIAQAQGAAAPTASAQQPVSDNSQCSWLNMWKPVCWGRGVAVWTSMGTIYVTGWALGIAGVLMNASIELTTVGFDTQIYARIQNGVEAVWTAFRDIANILIIGMFTFIALTMILGIEKFNARQMVAKVLLIAVLINFSLLFTRIIIQSSNFVAIQFYKAAQFGAAPASSTLGAAASFGDYSSGISGKFAQLMGVASFADTKEALWKVGDNTWDPGFMTLAMGIFTAIVVVAAALMFFYIAFLLIARALLFIFLLITSSLAFASYLVPNKGAVAGYGWDSWWQSLLKNAVFAPLLLMLLWATIQIGTGIKAISGSGTLGGLLADPTKGGNINALFCYLLILGMLYISVKIASKFAHEIGGFNYAALAPAYGAGLLGRLGGFLGRQTAGRAGLAASNYLGARAKESAKDGNTFASRLYLNSAKQFEGIAKRDFNLMRGQLGKEVQGAAGIKKLDAIAGKNLEGFKGTQEKFIKSMAEQGKKLELNKAEKEKNDKDRREAMAREVRASAEYQAKSREKSERDTELDHLSKQGAAMKERHQKELESVYRELDRARSTHGADSTEARTAETNVAEKRRQHAVALDEQNARIHAAREAVERSTGELATIAGNVEKAAVAAGRMPSAFKEASKIAEDLTKNNYTAALTRATIPGPAGLEKLAKKAGEEAGKLKKKEERKETLDLIKEIAKEEGGGHAPTTPPAEGGAAAAH